MMMARLDATTLEPCIFTIKDRGGNATEKIIPEALSIISF